MLTGIQYFNTYERGKSEIRDPHHSWAIFFRTSFINSNSLRYMANIPYLEDGEFMARVICLAEKVIFLNGPIYYRTTRPGSAVNSDLFSSERARNGFLLAAYNQLKFKNNVCKSDEQRLFMNQSIVHFTTLVLVSYKGLQYFWHFLKIHAALKKGSLKKIETEGCSDDYRELGHYYNRSLFLFYLYWTMRRFVGSMKSRVRKKSVKSSF